MLTLQQVAETIQVSESTVRRWVREGALPAYKVGKRGQVRVDEGDLRAFLEARRLRVETEDPNPAEEDS